MRPDQTIGPYGPRPSLALDDVSAESLLTEHLDGMTSPAKKRARDRWCVYTENYGHLIKERISTTHFDDDIIDRIFRHVDLAHNLAVDITSTICTVFKHSHASNMMVEGASERQNEALRQLIEESALHRHAPAWNKEAWLLGPVTVIPVLRDGRLSWDTLLPHYYQTLDNPSDPWGAPLAVTWQVGTSPRLGKTKDEAVTSILLDGESWRYYSHDSSIGTTLKPKLLRSVPHRVGYFPGATLSFDVAHGQSRWECDRHQRLIDATIKVGSLEAILDFVRKSQNKYLIAITGNLAGMAEGQVLSDPEGSIEANSQNKGDVAIDIKDFSIDPTHFITHQAWVMSTVAKSYGGLVSSRPGAKSILEAEVTFSYEALTEQRNTQIPFARDFLCDLLSKAVATCKAQGHRLAAWLPEPKLVREGLLVRFPPLSRSFASIDEQLKWEADGLSRGKLSFADLVRSMLPGASDEELHRYIAANLDSQAPLIAKMTTRDQSLSRVPASETESQKNGRMGPEARDQEE